MSTSVKIFHFLWICIAKFLLISFPLYFVTVFFSLSQLQVGSWVLVFLSVSVAWMWWMRRQQKKTILRTAGWPDSAVFLDILLSILSHGRGSQSQTSSFLWSGDQKSKSLGVHFFFPWAPCVCNGGRHFDRPWASPQLGLHLCSWRVGCTNKNSWDLQTLLLSSLRCKDCYDGFLLFILHDFSN